MEPSDIPRLRIAVTYNVRTDDQEKQAERLRQSYVDEVCRTLRSLGHDVEPVEVSGTPSEVFRRLARLQADLVFNLAEGERGVWREALYPMLYDFLGLPYTGAGPGVLALGMDKRLTEEALASQGVRVPRGRLIRGDASVPDGLDYPLMIKPNFEGSSMGIHQDSVVHDQTEAEKVVARLLEEYPAGLNVEEYIPGRELSIGYLEAMPGRFTDIVEYRFPEGQEPILDYETKQASKDEPLVDTLCPAPLPEDVEEDVRTLAAKAVAALRTRDLARVDLRLRDDGRVYLIEVNPLPGLRRGVSPLPVGAMSRGHSYAEVLQMVVASAAQRYGLVVQARAEGRP